MVTQYLCQMGDEKKKNVALINKNNHKNISTKLNVINLPKIVL